MAALPPAALASTAPATVSAVSGPGRLLSELAAAIPGRQDSLVGQHMVTGLVRLASSFAYVTSPRHTSCCTLCTFYVSSP